MLRPGSAVAELSVARCLTTFTCSRPMNFARVFPDNAETSFSTSTGMCDRRQLRFLCPALLRLPMAQVSRGIHGFCADVAEGA